MDILLYEEMLQRSRSVEAGTLSSLLTPCSVLAMLFRETCIFAAGASSGSASHRRGEAVKGMSACTLPRTRALATMVRGRPLGM